jgi:hypothetical protein
VERGGSAFVASAALRSLSATVKPLSNKEQSQTSHYTRESGQALDAFQALESSSVTSWVGISYPDPPLPTELSEHQLSKYEQARGPPQNPSVST